MLRIAKPSALAAVVIVAAACGRSIETQTMAAPDAGPSASMNAAAQR